MTGNAGDGFTQFRSHPGSPGLNRKPRGIVMDGTLKHYIPGVYSFDPHQIGAEIENPAAEAVWGVNKGNSSSGFIAGPGPFGVRTVGVFGRSPETGIFGFSDKAGGGTGVAGNTNAGSGNGVHGHTSTGVGVLGTSNGSGPAGRFEGIVQVTVDLQLTDGQDCAEEFDIANADLVEPGTVMVLGDGGILEPSQFAYDKRVAGVISGAGNYKPGIVLDKREAQPSRKPIALVGKVYCKADARYGAIKTGDLLTTSPTPGHAMKATDGTKAFGAVIGKALRVLDSGQALIPILIALQ